MITTFCQHGNYQNRAKARTRFMQETLGPNELRLSLIHISRSWLNIVATRLVIYFKILLYLII